LRKNSICVPFRLRTEACASRVRNGIYVSGLKYAKSFDHSALVSGIARTYSQRGIAVRSEPTLPGGKHADLAVSLGDSWTYIEVKTRGHVVSQRKKALSHRQDFLRELLRLRAHSLKQLPKKEPSLVVVATSSSSNRRKAINKIALAHAFKNRIFDRDTEKILGLMIFAPFRGSSEESSGWHYASTLIPNPKIENDDGFEKLTSIQL